MMHSRLQIIPAKLPNQMTTVRLLIRHPMETGFRFDVNGSAVPKNVIHTLTAFFEGKQVFSEGPTVLSEGPMLLPEGPTVLPEKPMVFPEETTVFPEKSMVFPERQMMFF